MKVSLHSALGRERLKQPCCASLHLVEITLGRERRNRSRASLVTCRALELTLGRERRSRASLVVEITLGRERLKQPCESC